MIRLGLTRMVGGQLVAVAMLTAWFAFDVAAQGYPQRPVRLVVPAPAGGGGDDVQDAPVARPACVRSAS